MMACKPTFLFIVFFPEISVRTKQVSCRFSWKTVFLPSAPVDSAEDRSPRPVLEYSLATSESATACKPTLRLACGPTSRAHGMSSAFLTNGMSSAFLTTQKLTLTPAEKSTSEVSRAPGICTLDVFPNVLCVGAGMNLTASSPDMHRCCYSRWKPAALLLLARRARTLWL